MASISKFHSGKAGHYRRGLAGKRCFPFGKPVLKPAGLEAENAKLKQEGDEAKKQLSKLETELGVASKMKIC